MTRINTATGKPELEDAERNALANAVRSISPIAVNTEVEALAPAVAEMVQAAVVASRRELWKAAIPADISEERIRIRDLAQMLASVYREGSGHDYRYFPSQLNDLIVEGWTARNSMHRDFEPEDPENEVVEYHHLRLISIPEGGYAAQQRSGLTPEEETKRNALFYRIVRKTPEDKPREGGPLDGGTPQDDAASDETDYEAPSRGSQVWCVMEALKPHLQGLRAQEAAVAVLDALIKDGQTEMSLSEMNRQDRASKEDLADRINAGLRDAGFPMGQVSDAVAAKIIIRLTAE